jgi:hypothetical protein
VSASPTLSPRPPVNRLWLLGIRIAALLGPLVFWVIILRPVFQIPRLYVSCGLARPPKPDFPPLAGLLVTVPYVYILHALTGRPRKSGLAVALAMGSLAFLVSALTLVVMVEDGASSSGHAVLVGVLALSQGALVATAIGTYYSIGREPGDHRTLALGAVPTALYLALFCFVWLPRMLIIGDPAPLGGPVESLRTINAAEVTYASTFNTEYSSNLSALGAAPPGAKPTASAAGLIDEALASGNKVKYTFTYTAGRLDSEGKITKYRISARPVEECRGLPNYFTDESGVIRHTIEDRPATTNDDLLAG